MNQYSKEFVEECKRLYPNHKELHRCLDENSYLAGQYLDDVKEREASCKEIVFSHSDEEIKQAIAKMRQKNRMYSKWIREVERMEAESEGE